MLALQLVAGAVVVAAFAGVQLHLLDPHRLPYLLANVLSTGVLAGVAVHEAQWGFVLTNGFWAAISAVGVVQLARRSDVPGVATQEAEPAVRGRRARRPTPRR